MSLISKIFVFLIAFLFDNETNKAITAEFRKTPRFALLSCLTNGTQQSRHGTVPEDSAACAPFLFDNDINKAITAQFRKTPRFALAMHARKAGYLHEAGGPQLVPEE